LVGETGFEPATSCSQSDFDPFATVRRRSFSQVRWGPLFATVRRVLLSSGP